MGVCVRVTRDECVRGGRDNTLLLLGYGVTGSDLRQSVRLHALPAMLQRVRPWTLLVQSEARRP